MNAQRLSMIGRSFEFVSRSSRNNAVRVAAYIARERIRCERTDELFNYRDRGAPEHLETLLPEGAAERFRNLGEMANAMEFAERRKDSQVGLHLLLALPANAEVSDEDRLALARGFSTAQFVNRGLGVVLAIHAPHEGGTESESANWHAHLLITTRRIEGENFAAKKARDLLPEVRRGVVVEADAWGEMRRDHQNQYFRDHGIDIRVDPIAIIPGNHIGPGK